MLKMTTEEMTKREYRCEFLSIVRIFGVPYARIIRLEDHALLGPPVSREQVTTTSQVMQHSPGRIETRNSVYLYDIECYGRTIEPEK